MEDKNSIKERIMHSANILFANHGFKGTSMRDISTHAEVSLSMINYYFLSKSNLLLEILSQFTECLLEKLRMISNNNEFSAWEKLEKSIESIYKIPTENLNTITILIKETHLKNDEEVELIFKEFEDIFQNIFEKIFKEGIQDKSFYSTYSPEFLSTIIIGILSNSMEKMHSKNYKEIRCFGPNEIQYLRNHNKTDLLRLFKHILTTPVPVYSKKNIIESNHEKKSDIHSCVRYNSPDTIM